MDISLSPFSEILKLLISEAKKVRDFKPLFKKLASTMKRLVPIIQEIEKFQEKFEPGNNDLISLTKTMRRAKKLVHKCSRVREYSVLKINSYTKKIKEINEEFVEFCQIDMPLIQYLNQLRSRSQTSVNMEENSNIFTGSTSLDEDGQIAAAFQESLNMEVSPPGLEDVQRVILESFNDKGKGKQVQEDEQVAAAHQENLNMEEVSIRQAIEDSIVSLSQQEKKVAKSRAKVLERDEQIAKAMLYYGSQRRTNGSSSSTGGPLDDNDVQAQRMIWESFKK